MQLNIGDCIDRFLIESVLGEGGMARVFLGRDTRLNRPVAVKLIRKEVFSDIALKEMRQRFEREALIMAGLAHPSIVKVFDYGEYNDAPYLVLEYLPGGTLRERTGSPMPYKEAAAILFPITRALGYAHRQGIIHRDVKPSNIMFSADGDPMLTDFGIIKLIEGGPAASLTTSGVTIGTPEYMAPEQGLGKPVDACADIYALGVVFYELLTGTRPFHADTPMQVLLKHVSEPLPDPRSLVPDLPDQAINILQHALAKLPEQRCASMAEYGNELRALAGQPESLPSIPVVLPFPSNGPVTPPPTPLDGEVLATRTPESLMALRSTDQNTAATDAAGISTAVHTAGSQWTEASPTGMPTTVQPSPDTPPPQQSSKLRASIFSGRQSWIGLRGLPLALLAIITLTAFALGKLGDQKAGLNPSATASLTAESLIAMPINETKTAPDQDLDLEASITSDTSGLPSPTEPSLATATSAVITRPSAATKYSTPTRTPTLTPKTKVPIIQPTTLTPTTTNTPVTPIKTNTPISPTTTNTPITPTKTNTPTPTNTPYPFFVINAYILCNGNPCSQITQGQTFSYAGSITNKIGMAGEFTIVQEALEPCGNTRIFNNNYKQIIQVGATHFLNKTSSIPISTTCTGNYIYKITVTDIQGAYATTVFKVVQP